jgi:hypothetical protein
MMVAPAPASCRASDRCLGLGQATRSVPQCMNTMTTGASRLAARTAARVRRRSIALASPGRPGVATQDEASSATCETPMTAIFVPLTVVTYGAHAAAASLPMPTEGKCLALAAARVSARPARP